MKHEAVKMKSGKDLRPAQQVEVASNGRLLPIKEAPALGRNKEIKEETGQMEVSYHTKNSSYWKNVFFFFFGPHDLTKSDTAMRIRD